MKGEEFRLGEGLLWGTKLNEALTVNFGSCGVSDFAVAGVQVFAPMEEMQGRL